MEKSAIFHQSNSHLLQNAIGEIERLGAAMNKPILLGKPYRRHVLYVGKYEPKDTFLKLPSVGERDDQTKNAMGLLFQQSGDRIQKKEATKIHECVSFGMEADSLVYSLAAPIFNFERWLSGAIMVMDFNQQRGKLGDKCRELELCARKISLKMGFSSW